MGEGLLHAALLKIYCDIYEFLWHGKFRTSLKSMFTGKVVYNDNRSCHRGCLSEKVFLKILLISLQENACVGTSLACNFIRKRLQQRCFSMKFAKFLRTLILKTICKQLLLFACIFSKHLLYLSYFSNICF